MATSGKGAPWNINTLGLILGKSAPTAPVGSYVALLSATPTADNGTFTELAATNAYARATISASNDGSAATWTANTVDATGCWKTNVAAVAFPTATSTGWAAATGYAIVDTSATAIASAPTNTGVLYWGTFGSATTVGGGTTASFAIGAVKVTEA